MLILSSISRGLEVWSVNHTSVYENSGLKVFKIIKFLDEISNNWPSNILGTYLYKTFEFLWNYYWQCYNLLKLIHHFYL